MSASVGPSLQAVYPRPTATKRAPHDEVDTQLGDRVIRKPMDAVFRDLNPAFTQNLGRPRTALVVGSSVGETAYVLKARGTRTTALELDEDALDKARDLSDEAILASDPTGNVFAEVSGRTFDLVALEGEEDAGIGWRLAATPGLTPLRRVVGGQRVGLVPRVGDRLTEQPDGHDGFGARVEDELPGLASIGIDDLLVRLDQGVSEDLVGLVEDRIELELLEVDVLLELVDAKIGRP